LDQRTGSTATYTESKSRFREGLGRGGPRAADALTEAVDIMGRLQLGKTFTPKENARIVALLKTPTGDQLGARLPSCSLSSELDRSRSSAGTTPLPGRLDCSNTIGEKDGHKG